MRENERLRHSKQELFKAKALSQTSLASAGLRDAAPCIKVTTGSEEREVNKMAKYTCHAFFFLKSQAINVSLLCINLQKRLF